MDTTEKSQTEEKWILCVDTPNLCRSCLEPIHKSFFWLESFYLDRKFLEIYQNVISAEIDIVDYLPKKICTSCYNLVLKFDQFKKKALESEKLLSQSIVSTTGEEKLPINFVNVPHVESHYDSEPGTESVLSDEYLLETVSNMNDDKSEFDNEDFQTGTKSNTEEQYGELEPKNVQTRKNQNKLDGSSRKAKTEIKSDIDEKELDEECGKIIATNKMSHLRMHTKENNTFECEDCGACFSSKSNLIRHVKSHREERAHKCEICGKAFRRLSSKSMHMKTTHASERNDLCTICGKSFKHIVFLRKHMKTVHETQTNQVKDDNEYSCDECGNTYRTKASLAVHIMKHKEPKPFLCTICGKNYSTKAVLENHQKVHTGEKSLICGICRKSFRFHSTLRTHVMIHSGEKPLSCPICNKQFRQHAHLKTHIRGQHTGNRPFICSFCGKTFKHNCNLIVHTRIHTGETPYHCDLCTKSFYDSSSMKKHRKNHFEKGNSLDESNFKVEGKEMDELKEEIDEDDDL
ncbi:hypothetical protein ABEB36_002390 [Hypothenemus hampei]|uniref:Uncharacterized protein n=3 Tax=Hypothenemus hampei TaxID=57062 RepID=A0ABD1F5Z1_HYPHA